MLIEMEPHFETRVSFARTFCVSDFAEQGLVSTFVQHSISRSTTKGTVRVYDIAVSVRPESTIFGRWEVFELSEDNNWQLYIPKGMAHGFQTLEPLSEVTSLYLGVLST